MVFCWCVTSPDSGGWGRHVRRTDEATVKGVWAGSEIHSEKKPHQHLYVPSESSPCHPLCNHMWNMYEDSQSNMSVCSGISGEFLIIFKVERVCSRHLYFKEGQYSVRSIFWAFLTLHYIHVIFNILKQTAHFHFKRFVLSKCTALFYRPTAWLCTSCKLDQMWSWTHLEA